MRQKHVLRMAQKDVGNPIPFLYLGLGIYIIVKSSCYPWSIRRIDESYFSNPGKLIMTLMTICLLLTSMGVMLWLKLRKKNGSACCRYRHSSSRASPPFSRRRRERLTYAYVKFIIINMFL